MVPLAMPAAPCSSVFQGCSQSFNSKKLSTAKVDFIWATVQVYPRIPCESFLAKTKLSKNRKMDGRSNSTLR